ncbi:nuclear transport factor 2 family protein [Kitasatospora sp. NPDC002040]|uniref:nuclear transport factor 2 family protein n=1 Tax=Kitasatospora sp. NPDC002040 TaxID=3154661 RepID=UPI0033232D12
MDQALVDRMREYLDAGLAMDVEALDALYDPEFENVRFDPEGRVVTLVKDQFMARFRALRAQGQRIGETLDDVTFLTTSEYGGQGTIVMRRVPEGVPTLYTFVWRRDQDGWGTLVREFSFERDLGGLLAMVRAAEAASG